MSDTEENLKIPYNRKEYLKSYYASNKEKLLDKCKEKLTCEDCGLSYARSAKTNHLKSMRHRYIKAVNSGLIPN